MSFYIAENEISLWRFLDTAGVRRKADLPEASAARHERKTIDRKIRNLHALLRTCVCDATNARRIALCASQVTYYNHQMHQERKRQDDRDEGRGKEGKRREEKNPARLRGLAFTFSRRVGIVFPFCCPVLQLGDNKIPTRAGIASCFFVMR